MVRQRCQKKGQGQRSRNNTKPNKNPQKKTTDNQTSPWPIMVKRWNKLRLSRLSTHPRLSLRLQHVIQSPMHSCNYVVPCSLGNSKGGAGWRSRHSRAFTVCQWFQAYQSSSVLTSSFISSPGRLDATGAKLGEYCPTCLVHHTSYACGENHSRQPCACCWFPSWKHRATQWAGHRPPEYQSSIECSLGRNTATCNFSALVIAQGEAPLILNTPAITPCFNVGSTARYLSTGSCIQSALRVPVSIHILARFDVTHLELHPPIDLRFLPLLSNIIRNDRLIYPWGMGSPVLILLSL